MEILLRKILNSGGKYAVEADVTLPGNHMGRASSPAAIRPGRRETPVTDFGLFSQSSVIKTQVKEEIENQSQWDSFLFEHMRHLGSDALLALSLAFARANAAKNGQTLVSYIQKESGAPMKAPPVMPLTAIFSGGIHCRGIRDSIQQIMIVTRTGSIVESLENILKLYAWIETDLTNKNLIESLSSSSGFMVSALSAQEKMQYLTEAIYANNLENNITIAIDAAAEHLKKEDGYLFEMKLRSPDEFREILEELAGKYPVQIVEDPFDPDDLTQWKKFFRNTSSKIKIFGDDLSATQCQYINNKITTGEVVKMNQAGTLSRTLKTVRHLRKLNMELCVSHRSYETEDTFLCDLAVGIDAEYIKIGGPRRGDRTAKYNQLIRLYET